MDRRKSVIIVKDSDEDERCLNPPSIISTTIYLSDDDDDDDLIMDVKRKQERSVHNISPSPTKKLKSDVSSKTTQDRKMSEIAEDGEIVSSPEYDAADMEIKIHAEMTSSEDDDDQGEDMGGDGDDSTPTQDERVVSTKTADEDVEKREVIQVLDTPPEKTKDSFPQRELPVIKKRVVTTIERNDNVDVDHLEITAPAQNEVRRGKIVKKSNKDENSPKKSKVVTPEKERSSREAGDKKRPYDVYDERRIRSDSEYDEKRRVKKLEDTDDLRKHLLKRIGSEQKIRDYHERGSTSDRSKNRERSSRQRDYSSNTEERVEKSHDRDRHRESGRDSHRVIDNEKYHRQEVDRKREHREAAHHKETVHSHVSKSKHEKQRHATDSNDERRKHERHHRKERKEKSLKQDEDNNSKPTRKKKKRKHKTSDSDSSPIKPDNVQEIVPSPEKSPVAENPNKEATYDNISSGISEGEEISPDPADGGDDKSPPSERSYSRSPSEVSSRSPSRSPSLSPTPERSPTPQKKRAYFPGIEGCRNVEDFEWLNRIEEGTYGVVYRAKDKRTEEIVALKRLKMEKEREGFPITSLREINTLLKAQHPNIVTVREIVVGSNMDKIYIVMDYVEHDLKSLMSTMTQPFLVGEVKTLLLQLLRGVRHMHDNWILHRDIKASNLLLSHKGILKIGDFGLAREYGSPLKKYTSIVVTLWYRAPELLLGAKEYSTAIDMWSVGCVFAELLIMKPLFPGSSEIDQINKIFKELGTPNDKIWAGPPAYSEMPQVKKMNIAEHPYNQLRNRFGATFTDRGLQLLNSMLTYDPARRITADEALRHPYFQEAPKPVDPSMFPTWPAKSELGHKALKKNASPKPPEGGQFGKMGDDGMGGFHMLTTNKGSSAKSSGFSLKF